jgi:hypothetical protein
MGKKLTILLHGADRNLWQGGPVTLRVIDNNSGRAKTLVTRKFTQSVFEVNLQLPFDAGQSYPISIDAPKHRSAWHIISHKTFFRGDADRQTEQSEVILRLMMVPTKPTSSDLADGFDELDASSALAQVWTLTRDDYHQLDTSQQMALLNIEAKLRETFLGTRSLLSYVTGLRLVARDRLFILVKPDLKQIVDRSTDFAPAPGHKAPRGQSMPGHPDSWKHQRFTAGNVQLSFSTDTEFWPPDQTSSRSHSVDVDIDLAKGFGHTIEWLHNNVFKPGHKTDQTQIYSLLFGQGILPSYTLDQATSDA